MTTTALTPPSPAGSVDTAGHASRSRVPRGRTEWLALAVLLAGTAVLYLWNLAANGWANSYYAAAVQAMSQDWTAFFFGSLDPGNIVTVDKPPAALWVMALSARVFGFSAWSMLVPQALMGVGAVALLYATVRRVAGPAAGLLAGTVLALTPVAVLMFRFNNPDALLVLLMVAAAYATVRALEAAATRWLVLAGVLIGFAFLTKMAQAFLVLPALALTYLIAAPTGFWRRVRQLFAAGVAVVVSAGWWIATVELWPTDSRPYIGGSRTDSALELALGYNGLGRLFGGQIGAGGGPGTVVTPAGGAASGGVGVFGGFRDEAGLTRLFSLSVGGQVAWLLPAALALLVIGLLLTSKAPRTDRVRASLLLWGTWTVVSGLVFSLMSGIFHEYYTVALAPGIAAVVAIGGRELWRHRATWGGRIALAAVTAGTAAWGWLLLGRTPDFLPWLRWALLAGGGVAALVLLLGAATSRLATAAALAAILAAMAGPAAYAAATALTTHAGAIPMAGPPVAGAAAAHPVAGGHDGGFPGASGGGAPVGSLDTNTKTDPALVALLRSAGTRWSAATVGSHTGALLQLDSGTAVISIGGFSGGDPAPTLAEFQAMVAAGQVRYFVSGGGPLRNPTAPARASDSLGPGGPAGPGTDIERWVEQNFSATTVGGHTVYDLSTPKR